MSTNSSSSNPLGYLGIDLNSQPPFLQGPRSPTTLDQYLPGTMWKNTTTGVIYQTNEPGIWDQTVPPQASPPSPSGVIWNDNATTGAMSTNNGYIVTSGAVVLTLPTASAVGDQLVVVLNGGTSWRIAQAASQSIVVGASTTSVGAGGSITTSGSGQTISLVCVTANLKWLSESGVGTLMVV